MFQDTSTQIPAPRHCESALAWTGGSLTNQRVVLHADHCGWSCWHVQVRQSTWCRNKGRAGEYMHTTKRKYTKRILATWGKSLFQTCLPLSLPCETEACGSPARGKKVFLAQSCLTPCDPMDCSPQALLSIEFSRQEYWSGLPFPTPVDLPDTGIEPGSPALHSGSLPSDQPYRKERH